jgi:hypothetical protein
MAVLKLALPFSTTSPNAPSAGTPLIVGTAFGLDEYGDVTIDAAVLGATGGTLDIYFQSTVKGPPQVAKEAARWFDVAHLPQLANGAAALRWVFQITRSRGAPAATVSVTSDVSVNGTSSLAVNTILSQALGDGIRMVLVAGASTTAGAALVIDGCAYQY